MPGKMAALVLGLIGVFGSLAGAQEGRQREDWRRFRRPPVREFTREWRDTFDAGYTIVDGQMLDRPYELVADQQHVTINGVSILAGEPNGALTHQIRETIEHGGMVVVFEGDAPQMLRDSRMVEVLRVITEPDLSKRDPALVLTLLSHEADRDVWQSWLTSYHLPVAYVPAARELIAKTDAAEAEGEKVIAANQRLSAWAYPLTIFGMLMSVVSFGHLLQFPPRGNPDLIPSRRRAELCRATVVFLAMVAILSTLDLVWTLLTSQAGQMHELNPIGQHLLEDPWMLAVFKMAATLASCGLLLMLRRHPRAQLASWWMCLVCTLLTFRWLVLNSMFVA